MPRSFPWRFVVILLAACIPLAMLAGPEFLSPPAAPAAEAKRLALELDRWLQLRQQETFTIAALPSIRAFATSGVSDRTARTAVALNELQAWVSADTPVRQAFIVDRTGITVLSTARDWGQNWSARAFVKQALAGQLDVSAPSLDQGEVSLYYAAPILDIAGEVAGALVARVDAQELRVPVSAGSGREMYAVLVDEAGMRLVDGGDPARNFRALAPFSAGQYQRMIDEQSYGAQVTAVQADGYRRAADMIVAGTPDLIRPGDLNAAALSAQRLSLKPWTVLVLSSAPALEMWARLLLPGIAAVGCAVAAAILLQR